MTDKCELVINAALENNLEKTKSLIEQDGSLLNAAFDDQSKTLLHIVTQKGNLELVQYILEKNPQLILKADKEGNYPLHYAAKNGYVEITRAILQADKMSINLLDKNNNTPFEIAVDKNYINIVEIMLKECKSVIRVNPLDIAIEKDNGQMITKIIEICPELLSKEDSEGNLPLRRAINKAKAVSVKVILEANPKAIPSKNKDKSGLLTSILQGEHQDIGKRLEESDIGRWQLSEIPETNLTDIEKTETITLILEAHPQILQVRYKDGRTFAHTVVTSQNTARRKLATELFEKYPEARFQQDYQGNTPLHIAIQHNNTQVARTILAQGIDILEIYNKAGKNALHLATELRNYEIVKSILEIANLEVIKKGINSIENLNCLHIAAKIGYDDLVELILSKDQSLIEIQTSATKSTALHFAAFHGHLEVIKAILSCNQDAIKLKDQDELTPLDIAISKSCLDVVEYLIVHHQDKEFIKNALKQKNKLDELTILHIAAIKGRTDLVGIILNIDKDLIQETDALGLTPLDLAIKEENLGAIKSILKYHKEVALVQNASGQTATHSAIMFNRPKALKIILGSYPPICDSPLKLKDSNGWTFLHHAAAQGHLAIVRYLVKEKAKIDDINIQQDSPLHLAARDGHNDVVQYLCSMGADINLRNQNGKTPILDAIENGHSEVVQSILKEILENDSSFIANSSRDLLAKAIESGHSEVVKGILGLILKHSPLFIANFGGDLLAKAIESGQTEIVEYLIAHKNIIHLKAMHLAIKSGHLNVIKLLKEYGYEINLANSNGYTAAHLAAENGKLNVLTYLATKDPDIIKVKDNNHNSLLHSAAVSEDLKTIKYLVKEGLNIAAPNLKGFTPLHLASIFGRISIVQYLIQQEQFAGNLDVKDNQGDTPLGLAVKNAHLKVVKMLLKQKANLNTENNAGYTLIHLAVMSNSIELLSYLFDQGLKLDKPSKDGLLPLHQAAIEGKTKVIQFFYKKGLDINQIDNEGLTPFDLAIENGQLELVKWYLKEFNDVNISSYNHHSQSLQEQAPIELIQPSLNKKSDNSLQNTHLHLAAQKGYLQAVKLLIEQGASINTFNRDKDTPLHLAVQNGHTIVVQALLSKEANTKLQNKAGKTPLDLAQGKQEIVDLFTISKTTSQEAKTDGSQDSSQEQIKETSSTSHKKNKKSTQNLEKKTNDLKTMSKTDTDIKTLIQDIDNTLDSQGNTSLHLATMRGNAEKIKQLLGEVDIKSKINAQNKDSFTALHLAVHNGHLGAAEILLEHGAENIQNRKGNNPLHFAAKSGRLEIARLLIQNGAEVKATNKSGNTPLHLASQKGHLELVLFFLQNGAEINSLNNNHNNSLHLAAQNGHLGVVELLLEKGIDTITANKDSKTALDLAIEGGNQEVVEILKNSIEIPSKKASKQEILESKDISLTKTSIPLQTHVTLAQINTEMPASQIIRRDKTKKESALDLFKQGIDLHYAAKMSYLDAMDIILKAGADINALNAQGQTPLFLAISYNKMEMAAALIQKGAKVELIDLHKAMAFCMPENFIKSLANTLDNVNIKGKDGYTAGHLASLYGLQSVLDCLLKKGANLHSLNDFGHTWLHMASAGGQNNTIQFLLAEGAKEKAKDFAGNTPLHYAQTVETIKLLINSGADYTACNRKNFTPLDMAILNSSPEVISELTKYKLQNSADHPDARSLYMSQDRPSISSKQEIRQESRADNTTTKSVTQFMKLHETSIKSIGITSDEANQPIDKTYEHTEGVKSLGEEDINM